MSHPSLEGCSILLVEDEPLITLDIALQFEPTGATLITSNTIHHALILKERGDFSGAILDYALGEDSSELCVRLSKRRIPFLICAGFKTIAPACADPVHID